MSTLTVKAIEAPVGFDLQLPANAVIDGQPLIDNQIKNDIALLGFKIASNGSLAKYNLIDQHIDTFTTNAGIDTATSTDEVLTSGYYTGTVVGVPVGSSVHTSTGAATWTCPANVISADILVVAGGGGGAGADSTGETGGGAGGGGIVHHATYTTVPTVVYDLTVGVGGAGGPQTGGSYQDDPAGRGGQDGSNSSFNDNAEGSQAKMTAIGGGGGSAVWGYDGGSGGASGRSDTNHGTGTQGDSGGGTGYGNDGGEGGGGLASGGGGGAGAVGGNGSSGTGGVGGAGQLFSNFTSYGVSGYFGGGGAGGMLSTGGSGGGGASRDSGPGYPGTANTGGGGGGAHNPNTGGAGGSGTVIIKFGVEADNNDITLVSTSTTAETQPTKADIVMTVTSPAAALAIGDGTNGDVRAWVSRDGGTTFTQFTLTDQGDTGGQTILTAHDLTISGQPAGTSMKYKITTHNQALSPLKETRIHAVSLGWS